MQRLRMLSVALVSVLLLGSVRLEAQRAGSGAVHGRSAGAVGALSTFELVFPTTPVGQTSLQDCYFNCFFQIGSPVESCNSGGSITLVETVAPPFRVLNLRKGTAGAGCGGTPATLPVTLQPGEWLLQDFVFAPTTNGSFRDEQTYTVTPTGSPTATFSWVLIGSTGVSSPPTIVSFGAVPPLVRPGQPVTLSWVTTGANSVVIDKGVGAQPPSGSVTVTPGTTTTYTLTAMSGSQSATADVTVNVLTTPSVVISALPQPILQGQGTGGGTTRYTVSNNGGAPTSVTVSQSGTFFSQSPVSFTLAAGVSQVVTVTANALASGAFDGAALLTATGVQGQIQVPIKVFSTAPPAGSVSASPSTNRVDVAGPLGTSPTGSVSFRNSGNATLSGVLVPDVPWLIPQSGVITISPGATTTVTFTVDRTKRTESDFGSSAGSISLVYLSGSSTPEASQGTTPPVSTTLVSVVDTVPLIVTTAGPPALASGEIALFVPGVGHIAGSVGTFISDVSVLSPPGNRTINDIRFFYTPIGGGDQKSAALPPIGGNAASVSLADVVKNVFGSDRQVGSLQIRSASTDKLSVSTNVFNSTNPAGTYGTAIPVFRSDRGVPAGERLVLTGLRRDATSHTNLFIQETSGVGVTVQTEFVAANGASLGTRTDTVGPFELSQINNVVPEGAVSAVLTNSSSGTGKFLAYATPVDDASGDNWSVVDWSRHFGYSGSDAMVIPVAGVLQGANNTFFRTDLAITNTGSGQASGTLRYIPRAGEASDRQITLGGRQSSIITNVIGSFFNAPNGSVGYLLFTPASGTFVINSRTYTTLTGQAATYGTGVPTLAASASLRTGALRAIGALEDATLATIGALRPATFRTNFGLLETSGQSVTVRVTLRFTYPAGTKLQVVGSASKDYDLAPNEFRQLNRISSEILGASRDTLGDLRGLEVYFQVISGNGAVAVFTSSTDNGTGDSILRTD